MNNALKIVSFGEVLWDLFPSGKKFGGAPANFAFHCLQLGADSRFVSRVGADALGDELRRHCVELGLCMDFVTQDANAPTGVVTVEVLADGQPKYTIEQGVAWDEIEVSQKMLDWVADADAICFGSLAARSQFNRRSLQTLLQAAPKKTLKVLDLNLRDPFCDFNAIEFVLSRCNVLKLNDEELQRLGTMFSVTQNTIEEQIDYWLKRNALQLMIVTCGERGSYLATPEERVFTPSQRVEVRDTVGAGDAFTACTVVEFLRRALNNKPLNHIAEKATALAAFVCTSHGGTPEIPDSFRRDS